MNRDIIKCIGAVTLALIATRAAWSQSLEIDFVELTGRNLVVHYNIDDGTNSSREFLVQLYSSQDNFTTALTRVSGDVGAEVNAGVDKKIVWDITKELGAFKGDIALELRGRVYVPFVKIKDITEDQVFKHGKNYPLNWSSGNLSGQVNIELFNSSEERIWGENNVPNVGKFDWYIPGNVKKGKNYRLKFTNVKDRNDVVYSPSFIIKPKIPLAAKIAGLAILAVGVELIISQKSKTSEAAPYGSPAAPPPNN
jgi:hypothetical protein